MQLKHKQQPCFAALVHLRRRPTENKRFTYRHSATKPAESGARKCFSAFTLHFGRKNKHSPPRFDKNVYFLSLFIVPNGCDGVAPSPGGAARALAGPSPFSKTPAPAFKSELHALNERKRWGSEGEKQGLGPQNMAPEAHMAELSQPTAEPVCQPDVSGLESLKTTCIWEKKLFSRETKKFFQQVCNYS